MGAQAHPEPVEKEATLNNEGMENGPVPQQCMPHGGPPGARQRPDESPHVVHAQMQVAHPWQVSSHQRLDVVQVAGGLLGDTFGITNMTEQTAWGDGM